jgi:hypothetical protein
MKKLSIYAMSFAIIFSVVPVRADWLKYFTTAYWLPYTNGNQLSLDDQKALRHKIKEKNEKKLEKHLKGNDLRTFYIAKLQKTQEKKNRQYFYSSAYWFPYTCGNQFKIDGLNDKITKLVK